MIRIKIYGPITSSYEYAKLLLLKYSQKMGLSIEIEEINEIDRFINEKVSSVPAISIDHSNPYYLKDFPDPGQFVKKIIEKILQLSNYGNMKRIIVPIDFSEASMNALNYAANIARQIGAIIKVVHFYHPVTSEIDGAAFVDPKIEELRRNQLSDFIEDISKSHTNSSLSEVIIESEFILGFSAQGIVELSKDHNVDMIVLGSTGEGKRIKSFFGSVSIDVSKYSECPVILVPENYNFKSFGKLALALETPNLNKNDMEFLAFIMKQFNSDLHIFKIRTSLSEAEMAIWPKELEEMVAPAKISSEVMHADDTIKGIEAFVADNEIDLLVMTTKKRNVIENIFHKSITKRMAINSEVPLLILHHRCHCDHGGNCCKLNDPGYHKFIEKQEKNA